MFPSVFVIIALLFGAVMLFLWCLRHDQRQTIEVGNNVWEGLRDEGWEFVQEEVYLKDLPFERSLPGTSWSKAAQAPFFVCTSVRGPGWLFGNKVRTATSSLSTCSTATAVLEVPDSSRCWVRLQTSDPRVYAEGGYVVGRESNGSRKYWLVIGEEDDQGATEYVRRLLTCLSGFKFSYVQVGGGFAIAGVLHRTEPDRYLQAWEVCCRVQDSVREIEASEA